MDFMELGNASLPTVLILNIGTRSDLPGVSQLQQKYHLVIPLVQSSTDLESVADGIRKKCSDHVYAICVLSSGWPIVRRLLEQRRISADKTIVEGPECVPGDLVVHSMMTC
ncbi:hypothetical protein [Clostridium sp. D33t1_170424_F3]|uniref:hypothetical protein n=1 Tax=Clostridium sp. D33t1_170424_F3 TaxID=2787099 RepID=UPI0018AA0298|nr:hypothetical protein [Clostridium sp. D33t1_170424_F3]